MAVRGQWTLEKQGDSENLPSPPPPEVHLIEVLHAAKCLYQSTSVAAMMRAGIKHWLWRSRLQLEPTHIVGMDQVASGETQCSTARAAFTDIEAKFGED